MTVYDPIEIPISGQAGTILNMPIIRSPGYLNIKGNSAGGIKVVAIGEGDVGYVNVYLAISGNLLSAQPDPNLPVPGIFGGDPNISYIATIQAIDASEEE